MTTKSETGPRGGKTTVSKSGELIRKTFWIHRDEEEALRRAAYEQRSTEAAIIRQLLREHFKIDE